MEKNDSIDGLFRWSSMIHALMVREVKCRYASGNLGYIWSLLIPITWIAGLIIFFNNIDRQLIIEMPVPYFVASGMLPYVVFRQTVTGMSKAFGSTRGLQGFGNFRSSDVLFAYSLLELLNAVLLLAVVVTGLEIFLGYLPLADPAKITLGIVIAWMLAASFGRLAAIIGKSSDLFVRILPIALRPMFWISGIFFTIADIPGGLADILWFNPLLHTTELVRAGFFGAPNYDFVDLTVPCVAIAVFHLLAAALKTQTSQSL